MDIYKDKSWLYDQYVTKRRNLTDICNLLEVQYGIKVTPQTIYNWCEKYDLLKFRGKGRNLKRKVPDSPQARKIAESQRKARKQREEVRKRMRRGH